MDPSAGVHSYATFCALAGVDATDHEAAAVGLPPIDSLDMWPLLSGAVQQSPRKEIHLSDQALISGQSVFVFF